MWKIVQVTATVFRKVLKHPFINEAWIRQIVIDTPREKRKRIDEEEFIIETLRKVNRAIVKVSLWVREYEWRFLVYKIHVESIS